MNNEYNKVFENLYSDTREWLKFSESKNAALLTLNVATLFGAVRLFSSQEILNNYLNVGLLIFLSSSILICLYSFFPKKSKPVVIYENSEDENLLFYSNIRNLGKHRVLEKITYKYFGEAIEDNYLKDLSNQIYDLSYLIVEKNTCFKYGVFCTALAYLLGIIHILMKFF
ncbi:hypothetical protein [Rummeliibacillus stabekisii]|uniref:Pycsar effector protein domain-containing protein n=1 Tax=Rummeliibacillus stabekisii TaxID=241244 RepID=A0A143HF87_9BACL|nr:hypothetical protein [Rummeliibacillus stabekisii]AMX00399.1 hypothetical protein ATY39_13860 [Rummeliibacillus stabekisii]